MNPVIMLLSIYPPPIETGIQISTYTWRFIAVLLTIAKQLNHQKPTGGRMDKQEVVNRYNAMLFSCEKEWSPDDVPWRTSKTLC